MGQKLRVEFTEQWDPLDDRVVAISINTGTDPPYVYCTYTSRETLPDPAALSGDIRLYDVIHARSTFPFEKVDELTCNRQE